MIGNVVPLPLVNVIVFEDTDAVTKAFGVDEAVVAVPKSEPVNDVAVKAPVISTVFAAKSPFISGVPEPEAIYNLLLS